MKNHKLNAALLAALLFAACGVDDNNAPTTNTGGRSGGATSTGGVSAGGVSQAGAPIATGGLAEGGAPTSAGGSETSAGAGGLAGEAAGGTSAGSAGTAGVGGEEAGGVGGQGGAGGSGPTSCRTSGTFVPSPVQIIQGDELFHCTDEVCNYYKLMITWSCDSSGDDFPDCQLKLRQITASGSLDVHAALFDLKVNYQYSADDYVNGRTCDVSTGVTDPPSRVILNVLAEINDDPCPTYTLLRSGKVVAEHVSLEPGTSFTMMMPFPKCYSHDTWTEIPLTWMVQP